MENGNRLSINFSEFGIPLKACQKENVFGFQAIQFPVINSGKNQVFPEKTKKAFTGLNQEKIAKHSPKKPVWKLVFENWKNGKTEKDCLDNAIDFPELTLKKIHGEYVWLKNHFKL